LTNEDGLNQKLWVRFSVGNYSRILAFTEIPSVMARA